MPENPFVGPRPYRQDEPLFGRDAEAALLVDLLVGARVVVIQSPSGAGKSSLLEALLKPLLRERGFRLAPTCQIAWRDSGDTIPPWPGAQNPLLRDACLQLLGGEDVGGDLRQAVDRLECNPETALEDDQGLVLVFDQCEKLFQRQRTVRSEAALREFFAQVADVLRHPRRIALFALRHEYRSALDGYAGLVPTGFGNTYTLDFLRCPQAREVLEKTFATRGVEVTPEGGRAPGGRAAPARDEPAPARRARSHWLSPRTSPSSSSRCTSRRTASGSGTGSSRQTTATFRAAWMRATFWECPRWPTPWAITTTRP